MNKTLLKIEGLICLCLAAFLFYCLSIHAAEVANTVRYQFGGSNYSGSPTTSWHCAGLGINGNGMARLFKITHARPQWFVVFAITSPAVWG